MLRLVWRLLVVEFGVKPSRGLRRISAWRSVVRWSMCLKTALQPAHFPANPFRSILFHAWVFLFGKGCGFDEVLGWVCSILIGGLPAQIWSLGGASPVSFSDLFSPTGDCVCSVFSCQRFSLALSRRHCRRPILCGGAEVRLPVMHLNWSEWQLGFSGVAMNIFVSNASSCLNFGTRSVARHFVRIRPLLG